MHSQTDTITELHTDTITEEKESTAVEPRNFLVTSTALLQDLFANLKVEWNFRPQLVLKLEYRVSEHFKLVFTGIQ